MTCLKGQTSSLDSSSIKATIATEDTRTDLGELHTLYAQAVRKWYSLQCERRSDGLTFSGDTAAPTVAARC